WFGIDQTGQNPAFAAIGQADAVPVTILGFAGHFDGGTGHEAGDGGCIRARAAAHVDVLAGGYDTGARGAGSGGRRQRCDTGGFRRFGSPLDRFAAQGRSRHYQTGQQPNSQHGADDDGQQVAEKRANAAKNAASGTAARFASGRFFIELRQPFVGGGAVYLLQNPARLVVTPLLN